MISHDDFEHEVLTLDFGGENRKKPRYRLVFLCLFSSLSLIFLFLGVIHTAIRASSEHLPSRQFFQKTKNAILRSVCEFYERTFCTRFAGQRIFGLNVNLRRCEDRKTEIDSALKT